MRTKESRKIKEDPMTKEMRRCIATIAVVMIGNIAHCKEPVVFTFAKSLAGWLPYQESCAMANKDGKLEITPLDAKKGLIIALPRPELEIDADQLKSFSIKIASVGADCRLVLRWYPEKDLGPSLMSKLSSSIGQGLRGDGEIHIIDQDLRPQKAWIGTIRNLRFFIIPTGDLLPEKILIEEIRLNP
jgi:hypothetical protein